jgi:hypothetical protein
MTSSAVNKNGTRESTCTKTMLVSALVTRRTIKKGNPETNPTEKRKTTVVLLR